AFPQFEDAAGQASRAAGQAGVAARGAPPLPLGDVVISLNTARRQAAASGIKPPDRLRVLLIHGFLHLLGYDHARSATAARRMSIRERELLAYLEVRERPSRPRGPRSPR